MKSSLKKRFQKNWSAPSSLVLGVLLLAWGQTGSTQSCESANQIPSTAFFDLVEHQQADFNTNGELIHAKMLSFSHQDACKHAFRIKWIADDGSLNEQYYDANTFEKVDKADLHQLSQSAFASEPDGPGGGGNGPGGGGGGPGGGGNGPGGGGGGPGGGGGGPGGGGNGPGGGGGGPGGGGGGPGGGN